MFDEFGVILSRVWLGLYDDIPLLFQLIPLLFQLVLCIDPCPILLDDFPISTFGVWLCLNLGTTESINRTQRYLAIYFCSVPIPPYKPVNKTISISIFVNMPYPIDYRLQNLPSLTALTKPETSGARITNGPRAEAASTDSSTSSKTSSPSSLLPSLHPIQGQCSSNALLSPLLGVPRPP